MKKETFCELKKNSLYHLSHTTGICLTAPDTLQISITNRCNFKCLTCSVAKYATEQKDEPSAEILTQIAENAVMSFNIKTIIITGGEPLLEVPKIIALANVAKKHNLGAVLTTNAYMLDKHAKTLADAGITHFHVSMDGEPKTHNFLRQNNQSFEKADKALDVLAKLKETKKYKFSIGIAMLILKSNIPEIKWMYEYGIRKKADILDMLVFVPDNTNFESANKHDLIPTPADLKQFKSICNFIKKNPHPDCRLNPCLDIDLIEKYYTQKLTRNDWKCFAGYKNFFITLSDPHKKGRFEPCLFLCKKIIPLADYGFDLKKIWGCKDAKMARQEIKKCNNLCFQLCFSVPKFKTTLNMK